MPNPARISFTKIKIALKELRETLVWLKIIQRKKWIKNQEELKALVTECDELISIFVTSVKTAEKNKSSKNKKN